MDKLFSQKHPEEYFSNLFELFEIDLICNWLIGLDETSNFRVAVDVKLMSGIIIKVFFRGKLLNDMGRAKIVTEKAEEFLKEFINFVSSTDYLYWVEDDQKDPIFPVVKLYLYHKTKRYNGKIMPFEIQLSSPQQVRYAHACEFHKIYEMDRLAQIDNTREIYKKKGMKMADLANRLIKANMLKSEDWSKISLFGNFCKESEGFSAEMPDGQKVLFKEALPKQTASFKIANGILYLTEKSCCWSLQSWPASGSWLITCKVLLKKGKIKIGLGDKPECPGTSGNSKIFELKKNNCWYGINNGTIQMKNLVANEILADEIIEFKIMIANGGYLFVMVGAYKYPAELPYSLSGSFRVGIISDEPEKETYLQELTIKSINSPDRSKPWG